MEFINFVMLFASGYLIMRHPHREGLAFGLLVASAALTVTLFLIGTHTSILPPFNY